MFYNSNSPREVLWDFSLADTVSNITLKNHKPIRKNISLHCDAPWEGEGCNYASLVKDGDLYRIYYRGAGGNAGIQDYSQGRHGVFCVAESTDGKIFTKPNIGIWEFNGSKDNNIIFMNDSHIDNFSVYLDENPDCPPDARYKALMLVMKELYTDLAYCKSADGKHFEFVRLLPIEGKFDSMNLTLWDPSTKKYRIYFRGCHTPDGKTLPYGTMDAAAIRDIRMVESEDFVNWTDPVQLCIEGDDNLTQYYTNGITKYPRANIFYGMPVRYIDRSSEEVNYKHLPKMYGFREILAQRERRCGTAMTDCMLFFSRDGLHFEKTDEAFLAPEAENGENWIYGECYPARGMFETASDFPNEPNELSVYTNVGAGCRPVDFVRYALRMDGLRSWSADHTGGSVLTKPFTFAGNTLTVNFATSALGSLRIRICDESGTPIDGYDSTTVFGNSLARPIDFEKPLADLAGTPVRFLVDLVECDFYSFAFETN